MGNYKKDILDKICYTELVYSRINKKLNIDLSNDKIEALIFDIVKDTGETEFKKIGKNIYITNSKHYIRLTINSLTFRIITADRLKLNLTNQ
jgi:FKBP-type peptidyl-prolyl cis-trans isomerase (trigger factor)